MTTDTTHRPAAAAITCQKCGAQVTEFVCRRKIRDDATYGIRVSEAEELCARCAEVRNA